MSLEKTDRQLLLIYGVFIPVIAITGYLYRPLLVFYFVSTMVYAAYLTAIGK